MNSSFCARLVGAIALSGWFTTVCASVLSDAAAQLQPGQWVVVNTLNFNSALLDDGAAYQVLQYTEDMVWDPVSHQLLFVGGGHDSDAEYLSYSESTNSWTRRKPGGGPWACCSSHAYDGNAIIPSAGKLFFHQMAWDQADRLDVVDIASGTWSRTAPMAQHPGCCVGLEYFPELGGLVMADGRTGVQFYDASADRWSMVTSSVTFGEYHNFAEYSPVHKVLIFGGGEGSGGTSLSRMDANRQITRLGNAPQQLGTTHSIVTTDPNSGNFVVFFGSATYEFNPMTDTWSRITMTVPWTSFGEGGVWDTVATPISTYGVIAFAKYNGNNSRVYLYRHSPGSGAVEPTITFSANPMSVAAQGSTTLTWSSSNADSCTASGGWSGAKATGGSETRGPLTADTTFTLTCSNSGGGNAARSVTVDVASATPPPTVSLTASPSAVAAGSSSTLSWTTSDATSCNGTGGVSGWPGSKSVPNGSQSVGPLSVAATFTLSCTGAGGTTPRSVTVSLLSAPAVTFTANPTTVTSGARTTLNWNSQNATACAASGAWAGSKSLSGSEQSAPLNQTSTFNLDCTGAGGSTGRSTTVMVTAAPPPPPPPPAPAPTVTLTADPTSVPPNTSVTLTWSSTNATTCTASGGWSGSRAMSGTEQTTSLADTTSFMLECSGSGGAASGQVTVTVVPGGGSGGGGDTPEDSGGGAFDLLLLSLGSVLLLARAQRQRRLIGGDRRQLLPRRIAN